MFTWLSYVEPVPVDDLGTRALAPLRNGIYAGDGNRRVLASVLSADLPDVVPDSLRGHVAEVCDREGRPVDYRLAGTAAGGGPTTDMVDLFRQWRTTWMYDVVLGDLAQLRTLRRWLASLQPRSRIAVAHAARLDWRSDSVDPVHAKALVDQVGEIRRLLAGCDKTGWMLYDVTKNIRVRAGVCLDVEETLLASNSRSVIANTRGELLLHYDGPVAATYQSVPKPRLRLDGWVCAAETMTVHGGEAAWTADAATKALLADLAPAAPALRVTSVTAAEVFQPATAGLATALRRAAHHGTTLQITSTTA